MASPGNIRISPVRNEDIAPVCALAREIWLQHYPGIITVKQIEFMLAQRYSPEAIRAQLHAVESSPDKAWWDKLEVRGELCAPMPSTISAVLPAACVTTVPSFARK